VHRAARDGTQIKKSSIDGAGLGLFARKEFAKGATIAQYTGDLIRTELGDDPEGFEGSQYVLELSRQVAIDAARTNTADGRMMNDPGGTGLGPNVKFSCNQRTKTAKMVAKKTIHVGDEFLVSYGRGFWSRVRRKRGDRGLPIVINGILSAQTVYRVNMFQSRRDEPGEGRWNTNFSHWFCNCAPGEAGDDKRGGLVPYCTMCNTNRPTAPTDQDREDARQTAIRLREQGPRVTKEYLAQRGIRALRGDTGGFGEIGASNIGGHRGNILRTVSAHGAQAMEEGFTASSHQAAAAATSSHLAAAASSSTAATTNMGAQWMWQSTGSTSMMSEMAAAASTSSHLAAAAAATSSYLAAAAASASSHLATAASTSSQLAAAAAVACSGSALSDEPSASPEPKRSPEEEDPKRRTLQLLGLSRKDRDENEVMELQRAEQKQKERQEATAAAASSSGPRSAALILQTGPGYYTRSKAASPKTSALTQLVLRGPPKSGATTRSKARDSDRQAELATMGALQQQPEWMSSNAPPGAAEAAAAEVQWTAWGTSSAAAATATTSSRSAAATPMTEMGESSSSALAMGEAATTTSARERRRMRSREVREAAAAATTSFVSGRAVRARAVEETAASEAAEITMPGDVTREERDAAWNSAPLEGHHRGRLPSLTHKDTAALHELIGRGSAPPVDHDCRGVASKEVSEQIEFKVPRVRERKQGYCRRRYCECCAPHMEPSAVNEAVMEKYEWCSCLAVKNGLCRRCWIDFFEGIQVEHNLYTGPTKASQRTQ
jgi:hypothetical protein